MLITDKELLKNYYHSKRLWQGIPSIEVTKKGRTFITFYSGGTKEEVGNFSILSTSTDGKNFSEPIAVLYEENHRCFDPCLWIDPQGRLWWTWSRYPDDGLWATICDDPDADELDFCEPFFVGHNIMMNKPTVLSSGEWLFPIAIWVSCMTTIWPGFCGSGTPGAYAYSTIDSGKTFTQLGAADVKDRSFDEHYFLEMQDGRIRCFVRTNYGIGAADSFDGGKTWGKDFNTGLGGPSSRFFIRRLASGRILLINHYEFTGRNNLTAMLSEDDGKTWPYKLLLDERSNVSYPDATETDDGFIHITYDRERGGFLSSLADVMNSAREILTAKISEEDIIAGKLVNKDSFLKNIASKLTVYDGEPKNPFCEEKLFSNSEYAEYLSKLNNQELVISEIFNIYNVTCARLSKLNSAKLDKLVESYKQNKDMASLEQIISMVRSNDNESAESRNLVEEARNFVKHHLESIDIVPAVATELDVSVSYLQHIFKKETGITILDYRNAERLKKAKLLLTGCDDRIIDIAAACGFEDSSYFAKIFTREVGVSPTEYRKLKNKRNKYDFSRSNQIG